jgi:hypothetical protein
MMETINKRIERRLHEVVDQYRSMIIDPVEQEMGNNPNWKYLRSRLLKALGERGLSARITEVINSEFQEYSKDVEKTGFIGDFQSLSFVVFSFNEKYSEIELHDNINRIFPDDRAKRLQRSLSEILKILESMGSREFGVLCGHQD